MNNGKQIPLIPALPRRRFLQAASAFVAGSTIPSASLRADDNLWKLWVRYVTGGAPYPPSFRVMFLDPMFLKMEFVPADLPFGSYGGYSPLAIVPSRPPAPPPGGPAGFGNAPPILANNPPDTPWIPSSQVQSGIRGLMPGGNPPFSVVVLNDQADWPESAREDIQKAVASGRGFVVFHNALGDNQTWPWWYQEVLGGHLALKDHDGLKRSTITPGASLSLRPAGNHLIVDNIGPLRLTNEVAYKGMWQSPKITPLLETNGASSDGVVAWIGPMASTRVVCIQPGDATTTHRNPAFRKLVRNAILWAGGRLS